MKLTSTEVSRDGQNNTERMVLANLDLNGSKESSKLKDITSSHPSSVLSYTKGDNTKEGYGYQRDGTSSESHHIKGFNSDKEHQTNKQVNNQANNQVNGHLNNNLIDQMDNKSWSNNETKPSHIFNRNKYQYCTPRSYMTVESIPLSPESSHLPVPIVNNIWSTKYENVSPLNGIRLNNINEMPSKYDQPGHTGICHPTHTTKDIGTTHTTKEIGTTHPTNQLSTSPNSQPAIRDGTEYWFKAYTGNKITLNKTCRFFVIKSYSILDVNASFINGIWASTELGNKRLSKAYNAAKKANGGIYLFFLVNGSGRFSGICRMTSDVDFTKSSTIWSEESKWKGIFQVDWLLIKDIPNKYFQSLRIATNENKPVTNSRDTQEVPFDIAISMVKIFNSFKTANSFLLAR